MWQFTFQSGLVRVKKEDWDYFPLNMKGLIHMEIKFNIESPWAVWFYLVICWIGRSRRRLTFAPFIRDLTISTSSVIFNSQYPSALAKMSCV